MSTKTKTKNARIELKYNGQEYQVGIEEINREKAAVYLSTARVKRNINKANLLRLVSAQKSGHWDHLNGDTICFDSSGALTDGQHRLRMIENTGESITTFVIRGVRKDIFFGKDRGSRRQVSDVLQMLGEKNTRVLASALRLLCQYQNDLLHVSETGIAKSISWDGRVAWQLLKKHPGMRVAILRGRTYYDKQIFPVFDASIYGFLSYLLPQIDVEQARLFLEQMSAQRVIPESPVNILRKRLERGYKSKIRAEHLTQDQIRAMIIKCWNCYIQGRAITKIKSLIWICGTAFPQFQNFEGGNVLYEEIKWNDTIIDQL